MSEQEKIVKESKIEVKVGLNKENVPVGIRWRADDNPEGQQYLDAKGMLLSFFDLNSRDTLRIDLWTEDLQVMEMDRMVYHTLKGLSETYVRSTGNKELAGQMLQFAQYFGEKTEVLPPSKKE
nr:gliding motility protein GldC [Saprospiraceae bacterium]